MTWNGANDPEPMDSIDMKLDAIAYREGAEARSEMIEALTEDNPIIAVALYNAYENLVDAGFDEDQAMQLLIARGWHLAMDGE
jgi:hypothetical protein